MRGRDEPAIPPGEDIAVDRRRKRASRPRWPSGDPIKTALTRLHDAVAAEPLPEEFLDLLGRIDRKTDEEGSS